MQKDYSAGRGETPALVHSTAIGSSFEQRKQLCDDAKRASIGRFPLLLTSAGVPGEYLSGRPAPCPSCGGKDRFTFDDIQGRGTYFCRNCGAGDGISLLRKVHKWSYQQVCQFIHDALGGIRYDARPLPAVIETHEPQFDEIKGKAIQDLWQSAQDLRQGDRGYIYLTLTRRIVLSSLPSDLRSHQNLLLIGFRSAEGELVQIQKIALAANGQKYGWRPKLFMPSPGPGIMRGGAVRLHDATEHLAIGEGVETCLAWHSKNDKVPVWAALSRTLLESVVVPRTVKCVTVLADNDVSGDGLRSAQKLADRLIREGHQARILMPKKLGTDFADEIT